METDIDVAGPFLRLAARGEHGKDVAAVLADGLENRGQHTGLVGKHEGKLKAALEGTELTLSEPVWYGGNSTYENGDMVASLEAVKNADMLFAMGGGRAVDTCKYFLPAFQRLVSG